MLPARLAVVGAGPAALALLLRLARASCDVCSSPAKRSAAARLLQHTVVIDASGGWLALWQRKLRSQGVSHLRSPTFVHPQASRLIDDELLAFATARRRLHELQPLPEATPHNAPKQWHAPSADLFNDFCAAALEELHGVDPTLCERLLVARVTDIVPLPEGGCQLSLEQVDCSSSSVASPSSTLPTSLTARRVVLAVGDSFAPRWPSEWVGVGAPRGRIVHAADLASSHSATTPMRVGAVQQDAPHGLTAHPLTVRARVLLRALYHVVVELLPAAAALVSLLWRWSSALLTLRRLDGPAPTEPPVHATGRRLLIVGCGLSGAQLAGEALLRGWQTVTLLSRAPIAVRPFDIADEWVRRHLSWELQPCEAGFFGADSLAERRAILARARPGGSVTSALMAQLRRATSGSNPRTVVRECAEVTHVEWSAQSEELHIHVSQPALCGPNGAHEACSGEAAATVLRADGVWLATGHALDASRVTPLETLRTLRPQPFHDGLPELTPSLRWDPQTDVWVAGALAALQLGPDALNLAGAGLSAARIVSEWEDSGWL